MLFRYSNWWEWLVSWGHFSNLSFVEARNFALDAWPQLDSTEIFQHTEQPKNYTWPNVTLKYLPNIGMCKQVREYDPLHLIVIENKGQMKADMDIFLTDPRYSTHYKLDYESHYGDPIRIPAGSDEMYSYNVDIEQVNLDKLESIVQETHFLMITKFMLNLEI